MLDLGQPGPWAGPSCSVVTMGTPVTFLVYFFIGKIFIIKKKRDFLEIKITFFI